MVVLWKWGVIWLGSPNEALLLIYSSFFFKEADVLLRDTLEAARWCELQTFKGTVSLHSVIGMDGEGRITTLKEVWLYDGLDEEEHIIL
jgi:hypothetical protein